MIMQKTTPPISTKFSGKVTHGPPNKPVDFGVNRDHAKLESGRGEGYIYGEVCTATPSTEDTLRDVCLTLTMLRHQPP